MNTALKTDHVARFHLCTLKVGEDPGFDWGKVARDIKEASLPISAEQEKYILHFIQSMQPDINVVKASASAYAPANRMTIMVWTTAMSDEAFTREYYSRGTLSPEEIEAAWEESESVESGLNSMTGPRTFLWHSVLGIPFPVIVHDDPRVGCAGLVPIAGTEVKLAVDDNRTLDQLEKDYPAPKITVAS